MPAHATASPRASPAVCLKSPVATRLQNVHRVSLKKLPYTVLEQADAAEQQDQQGQQPGAGDGPAGQQQQQQDGSEGEEGDGSDEEGSSGSEADDDAAGQEQQDADPPAAGAGAADDPDPQQQPAGSGSEGGSEDEEEGGSPLDAFPAGTAAAVEAFAAAVEADPAALLQPVPELAALAKSAAKALYDYQAALDSSSAAAPGPAGPAVLPELYIEGFDAEQIWLQLELAAAPALKRARKLLRKVGEQPQLLTPETEEAIDGGCWRDAVRGALRGSSRAG